MGLKACCFCISAITGARVIGVLQMLGCVRGLVDPIFTFKMLQDLKSTNNPDERQELFQALNAEYPALKNLDEIVSFLQMQQVYLFISGLLGLITAVLLVYGLQKAKPKLVLIHLIVNLICYFVAIFMTIFIIIYSGAAVSQFLLILLIILNVIALYFLFVVHSAYLDVQKAVLENQNPAVVSYSNA